MGDTVDRKINDYYKSRMATGMFYQGTAIMQYLHVVGKLVRKHNALLLLDYGCGAGQQYHLNRVHEGWEVPIPTLYDPASETHNQKPEPGTKFDGVICTDVLEHVPQEKIDALLEELYGHADKFLFMSVCCRAASKCMPDGRNVHVLVRPQAWWEDKFRKLGKQHPELDVLIRWSN